MKKILLILFAYTVTGCNYGQISPASLDSLVSAYERQNSFNGTVLVAQKGKIILEKGYGFENKKENKLNTANTIYQIGSITKQFTSAIILQLVEKQKMGLQDRLSKYIPDYPMGDSITVENLLTHTSGIYNYTDDENFMKTSSERPISRDSLINLFKNKPLDFPPGTKWSYSNSGYILLGIIIEKVTHKSYFQVARESIFEPLEMSHTGFDFTNLKSPDKATGYSGDFSTPVGIVDSSVSFAAGSIYTTVGDLYKWDQALYTNRIISQALLQKAFTPYKSNYGYGWQIVTEYNKKITEHGGGITGFVSYILRVPDDQICIIALSNVPSPTPAIIANQINGLFNGKKPELPVARKEIHLDSGTLKLYTGEYELAPSFHIVITMEKGVLEAQATNQGKNPLFAEKANFFFLKVVDAQVEFFQGPDGKIDHLVLYQNGQKVEGKKLSPDAPHTALPVSRKEISVDTTILKSYTGEYELAPAFHITITLHDGTLQAQATGQGSNPLYAEKPDFFFLKVVDAQIEFIRGSNGQTDHLILYQNGNKVDGKKIK
ncbi:MAG TPA: serine hydrolase [Candidatus Paceibacterota bacterium]|jgi:CubicO group peptidase (beta-lactamase class C family)|nr:serine hydrolase [Candidatus Paceibacterota bacterium]